MPGRDGTGPAGPGRGRMGGSFGEGLGGFCKCPNCGTRLEHQRQKPCNSIKCPQCGSTMIRG